MKRKDFLKIAGLSALGGALIPNLPVNAAIGDNLDRKDIAQLSSDLSDKASMEYVNGLVKTDMQTLTFTNGFRHYATPYEATRVVSVIGDSGYVVGASICGINSLYLYVANNTSYSGDIVVRIKYI